ncbi:KAP family P-loop NTPase fold protein [Prevotella pectinovora]|uniref:KAP family P-loop NTPase fold protein n=1 Tax=Prevotella pectinovora TaxID=1602169 RepID=UPI003078C501
MKLRECFTWLRDVTIKPILIVLIATLLDKPIEYHLLSPLWGFLNLEYSKTLLLFVALISIIIGYNGWQMYRCKYDKKHISLYLMACGLYVLYNKRWSYINVWLWIDCWNILLSAYPLGVVAHWLYKRIKRYDGNNDELINVPPIILLDDEPVKYESEDEFRYGVFAQRIAQTITESTQKSSFSLGVTGIWGAGKTSMLNLLKRQIEKDDSCILVDFNPRESADVKLIQHDFLTAICSALKKFHTGATHIMSDYMKGLRVFAKDTPWLKVLDIFQTIDVDKSRHEVESMIRSIDKKIVVIIDDYDRLTGEEIVEVLKVIGNNGSFERTFFVSAYDKKYVNQVLKAYFHETVDRDYTDKYFNLELRLPDRKQFYKNRYLQKRLQALFAKGIIKDMNQGQIDEALSPVVKFIDCYLPTPRDIKRYIGLVMASFVEIQDNVALRDFLILRLIKYKYPQEYDMLYKHLYFKQYSSSSDTNYVLKDAQELSGVKSFPVLSLMFPSTETNEVTDKTFGYKHLSWKRSFDYYFFDQELGHISLCDLIILATPDVSIEVFKKAAHHWEADSLKKEVSDFVMKRATVVHSEEAFKEYLRLSFMARYFCPTHELYIHCLSLLVKNNLKENAKDFGLSTEVYTNIIDEFINKRQEWVLSAILLQDALTASLRPGMEIKLIFSHTHLQSVAEKQLTNVINTFHAERATTEDVYEMLKANIKGVFGDGSTELSKDALSKVKEDMVNNAKKYLKDIVWHNPIQGKRTGIVMGFNSHLPLYDLFATEKIFGAFLKEVDEKEASLSTETSCLYEIYERFSNNKFKPFNKDTRESNHNIRQCDFQTYNLIFEGER